MKRFLWLLVLGLVVMSSHAIRFDETRVLVHLSRSDLHDTSGFNLVEQLPPILYKEVVSGRAQLWDGPQKKIRIHADALKQIDEGRGFTQVNDLFLAEKWILSKKKLFTELAGFALLGKNSRGETVNLGYIDASDVKQVLTSTRVLLNANGFGTLNFWEALMAKNYPFNITQFGGDDFKSAPMNAINLKLELFHNPRIRIMGRPCPTYEKHMVVQVSPNAPGSVNAALFKSLNIWLNLNREFFMNHGGNQIHSHLEKDKIINADQIQVSGIWSRQADGSVQKRLESMVIFVDGKPMSALTREDIKQMDVTVKLQAFSDYLESFSFAAELKRINDQDLSSAEAVFYELALQEAPWNQLTLYVNKP